MVEPEILIEKVDIKPTAAAQPQTAIPAAPPEPKFSVPISVPSSLMGKLVQLSSQSGTDISTLCMDLVQKAVNSEMLGAGTINDISEDAQDVIRTVSLEAALDALRIYNVPKSAAIGSDTVSTDTLTAGDIVFNTTSDVKDMIAQIDAHRIKKGLAPLENSICELLYHYGENLRDYNVCEAITGMSFKKFAAVTRTLALNEREQNGAVSNVIDDGGIFNKFTIIDTPDAVLPAPAPVTTDTDKAASTKTPAPAKDKK